MTVHVPPLVSPYPPSCTDASWKGAKTDSIRDKWNTELGAALRDAQTAYNKIKFDNLDIGLFINSHHNVRYDIAGDIDVAKIAAQSHYNVAVKPAIRALEKARSKAATASLNPIISSAARAKARQIAQELRLRLVQLKTIDFTDYDQAKQRLLHNLQFAYHNFDASMTSCLANADRFVKSVRKTPTAANFNDHIEGASRGITQNIGQVEKLYKNGHDLGKDHLQATRLFNILDPWANGQVKVPDTANSVKVLAKVVEFNNHVSAVKVWWG